MCLKMCETCIIICESSVSIKWEKVLTFLLFLSIILTIRLWCRSMGVFFFSCDKKKKSV